MAASTSACFSVFASQDCVENALEELGLDNIRLSKPVIHGDTLYAYTEVRPKSDGEREDAGLVDVSTLWRQSAGRGRRTSGPARSHQAAESLEQMTSSGSLSDMRIVDLTQKSWSGPTRQ